MFDAIHTRVVLIETSHPGNIGSVARAMKTMGLYDLVLVKPRRFPADDAYMMAAGADDILENVTIVTSLEEAIADKTLIMGTSARDRSLPWPLVNPRKASEIICSQGSTRQSAILFGREDKGLKNEELQRCHYHVQIPANPQYSSLNLAQAVQVLSYELRMQHHLKDAVSESPSIELGHDDKMADARTLELLYQHIDDTLHDMEFLSRDNPNRVMPRIRRMLNRARIDHTELNILRGMLSKMQWHLREK